jgi:hypothetical protein
LAREFFSDITTQANSANAVAELTQQLAVRQ